MGQIDLMSKCEYGPGPDPKPGGQSTRMRRFMETYLDAQKTEEHRVAIQLMRHTLMHTGSLNFLYEVATQTGYTWRVHFANTFGATKLGHYTLTTEPPNDQPELIAAVNAVGGTVATAKSFNINITEFAADIKRVAGDCTSAIVKTPSLQTKCELAYPEVRVQTLLPMVP